MRFIFIPGLGEEPSIFDRIESFFPGEKVFVDNWTLLEKIPEKGLNVLSYAGFLIDRYKITKEDVIIGHSMGGWVALHIKHIVGCKILQISSWTNMAKLIKVPLPRTMIYWFAKRGVGFNRIVLNTLVCLHYRNKPSRETFISIFERMRKGNKEVVAKQLMIIFNPVKERVKATPELRIHAKPDHIVEYPDEYFYEVPGDHFSLATYPQEIYTAVKEFLKNNKIS